MHYYQFNIKSYQTATLHLSNEEDLAYRRLMDFYYDGENFISAKPNKATALPLLSRRLRVGIAELESVLNEFFTFEDECWKNEYCDQVIADYRLFQEKQRANGSKGGRGNKANANPNKPTALPNKANAKPTINNKQETINQSIQPFAEFWSEYPKRKNKGDAEKAWLKLNPSIALQNKIFESLEILKTSGDWKKENGQFIPYPASWLNAQGWEDEVTGSSPASQIQSRNNGAEWLHPSQGWVSSSNIPMPERMAA